jgi:hypothetical protein
MKSNHLSMVAFVLAIAALALTIQQQLSFKRAVTRLVEQRERAYCLQLAGNLNQTRDMMGLPPVSPNNFAEVLNAYFASMAAVMDQGVTNMVKAKARQ